MFGETQILQVTTKKLIKLRMVNHLYYIKFGSMNPLNMKIYQELPHLSPADHPRSSDPHLR